MSDEVKRKVSQEESGDAKNLAAMEALITAIEGFGEKYNPTYENIKLASLKAFLADCKTTFSGARDAGAPYRNAVNLRREGFATLGKDATRLHNSFASSSTDKQAKDALALAKKVRGGSSKEKVDSAIPTAKTISTSQMSYTNRIENARELLRYIESAGTFDPNEADLKPSALKSRLDTLAALNANIVRSFDALDNKRTAKNKMMYVGEGSLVDRAQDAKKYVKSIFGASSPEFKKVVKIEFKKQKK